MEWLCQLCVQPNLLKGAEGRSRRLLGAGKEEKGQTNTDKNGKGNYFFWGTFSPNMRSWYPTYR